ncbi:hypothetical protein [Sphingomonas sp.]|uniref:hypothetical protein n=1 Tax=Sphingomonas sp. TaxID=28214 RepID=UPI003B3B5A3A
MATADRPAFWKFPWIVKGPLIGGLALLLIAMALVAARWQFLATASHATATVSAVTLEAMQDNSPGYRISVSFRDPARGLVTVRSSVVSSSTSWRVGDQVGVDYPAGEPEQALIATFVDRWLAPLVIGGIAMVALIIGGCGAWMMGRPETRIRRVGNAVVGMSWQRGATFEMPPPDTAAPPPGERPQR